MIRSLGVALLAWSLTACAPMVYIPNQLHTPMLRDAGDVQATLGTSNLSAAVAVSPNVLLHVAGHYQALDFDGPLDGPQGRSHQWLAEGGLGLYGDLGYKDVRWTLLAGGGGGASWSFTNSALSHEDRLARGYVQSNIGYVTPYFEIVGSARFSGVAFNAFPSTGGGTPPLKFFIEPAVTVKVGYRWVKLYAQPMVSIPLADEDVHLPLNLVVGLSLDLAQWHGN